LVIWSEPAKADLQSIHQFIAHDSKPYAKKVIWNTRKACRLRSALMRKGG
jgi:hypothetical protein